MVNTDLVRQMRSAGMSERRAEAFERALDDRPICGISGTVLAEFISKLVTKEADFANHARDLSESMKAREAAAGLELFESSAYGSHVARRSKPGSAR